MITVTLDMVCIVDFIVPSREIFTDYLSVTEKRKWLKRSPQASHCRPIFYESKILTKKFWRLKLLVFLWNFAFSLNSDSSIPRVNEYILLYLSSSGFCFCGTCVHQVTLSNIPYLGNTIYFQQTLWQSFFRIFFLSNP